MIDPSSSAPENIPPWITDRIENEEPKGVDTQIKSRYPASPARPGDQIHTLQGYVIRETEKAILFETYQVDGKPWEPEEENSSRNRQLWFPLSQVKSVTRAAPANGEAAMEYDNLQVKEWILSSKGLI